MTASALRARPLRDAIGRIGSGLKGAYGDAFASRRLAWASPAIAVVGAFVGFWLLGLLVTAGSIGTDLPRVLVAAGLGLTGLLVGVGYGFGRPTSKEPAPAASIHLTRRVGVVLVITGLSAMALYFLAIGDLPLFRPSLEQARVDAAEEGGAALRVLSMLAIPGCWLLVAWSSFQRRLGWLAGAVLVSMIVAAAWVLTGNRAPAFQVLEVGVVVGVLSAGFSRLRWWGVAALMTVGLALVLAAGVFGAVRLASQSTVYGPPDPNRGAPNYVRLTQTSIAAYLRVPVQNLRFTMVAVPERIGWRLGSTYLLPIATITPGKQRTFDAMIKDALGQTYAGGGTVPGMLGEAYANFGPAGWLLVPILIGLATAALYRRASSARSPAWWALYGYAIIHITGANLSGLSIASIFPWEAYAVLSLPIILPWIQARLRRVPAGR